MWLKISHIRHDHQFVLLKCVSKMFSQVIHNLGTVSVHQISEKSCQVQPQHLVYRYECPSLHP